jgi:hypothetical protein
MLWRIDDFLNAMIKLYETGKEGRAELGKLGREHVMKNYNFEDFNKSWVQLMESVHQRHGSWGSRKNRQNWRSESL